jgi:hypothetical protein
VFVGGLATNFDHRYADVVTPLGGTETQKIAQHVGDAGVQMDLRFTSLSRLDMTLSFGYAAAFEQGLATRREAMISLKVMQ